MLNENGGSRTDTLIKLVLVFFLSLLSFSVGTFVGKQFSDSQHRVADLEGDTDRVVASVPADVTKAEPNQAISEEEISKLSDEFVKKERDVASAPDSKDSTTSAPMSKPSVANKPIAVHDEIAEVTKKIAQGMKVEPPKAPVSRMPTNYPKEQLGSAIGKYTVQLSSHPTEDEAKAKAKEYRDKGYSAFYVPAPIKGKTWYRVSVGQFTTADEAKKYKSSLSKDSVFASAIVQKITQ
jgi:septal ring-binding cell division protein DamX